MSRKKIDPAVDVVRIVSMLANEGDYIGIADGDDTPLGALADAVQSIDANGRAWMTNAQTVEVLVAIVRSVPPRVLAKMRAAALDQEALHHKWGREKAEQLLAERTVP